MGSETSEGLKCMLVDELQDLYSAETQLVKALPEMANAASSAQLKKGIEDHLLQTQNHVKRLDDVFNALDESHSGRRCKAMEGLIAEGQEVIRKKNGHSIDAALICAAQKVEHYEMAGYGCVRAWAEALGMKDAVKLLEQTLNEEKATDKKLTDLAKQSVNPQALSGGKSQSSHGEKSSSEDKNAKVDNKPTEDDKPDAKIVAGSDSSGGNGNGNGNGGQGGTATATRKGEAHTAPAEKRHDPKQQQQHHEQRGQAAGQKGQATTTAKQPIETKAPRDERIKKDQAEQKETHDEKSCGTEGTCEADETGHKKAQQPGGQPQTGKEGKSYGDEKKSGQGKHGR